MISAKCKICGDVFVGLTPNSTEILIKHQAERHPAESEQTLGTLGLMTSVLIFHHWELSDKSILASFKQQIKRRMPFMLKVIERVS